jgi:hypothetical protein
MPITAKDYDTLKDLEMMKKAGVENHQNNLLPNRTLYHLT